MSDYYDRMTFTEKAKHQELQDKLEATNRAIVKLGIERHDLTRRIEAKREEAQRLASHLQALEKEVSRRPLSSDYGGDAA